jgi:hypothetical protein
MAIFDPVRSRTNGFNDEALKYKLAKQYDANNPMGNHGVHGIDEVIRAWLVGRHREIAPMLPRYLEWIDKAFARKEQFGGDQNQYRASLYQAKALGGWMNGDGDVESDWDSARVFEEAWWRNEETPWTAHQIVKDGLDDYMAFAFQGGDHDEGYEAGIEMFERWTGKNKVSFSKLLKPRELGYALCLHQTARQSFDEEDLFKAGRKMLQANLQENWLGRGGAWRAAMWLKIVYWHRDRTLTPLQTILKAYENMPDVVRPDFVMAD